MTVRRFEEKNVIVTGAGQGIGRAIAERFAAEGADVMLIGRRREPLDEVERAITGSGGKCLGALRRCQQLCRRGRGRRRGERALGQDRRPRQQRRHRRGEALPRDRGRRVGPDPGDQPPGSVLDGTARRPPAGEGRRRLDRPHRLDRRVGRRRPLCELQRLEGRAPRTESDDGPRARALRCAGQLRQPGVHAHRDDRGRRASRG